MLKLIYTRKNDRFQTVTLLGDAAGIRDLYWQLTRNYVCSDGTKIGDIAVFDLDGADCTDSVLINPHGAATRLSSLMS